MNELRPSNYLETLEKWEKGCDRTKCADCPALLKENVCTFDRIEKWKIWADEQHKDFKKFLDEEEKKTNEQNAKA